MKVKARKPFIILGKKVNVGDIVDVSDYHYNLLKNYDMIEDYDENNTLKQEQTTGEKKEYDFEKMSYNELIKLAKEHNVFNAGMKKKELIEQLKKII